MELKRDDIIKALECFHKRILNTNLAEKVTECEMMAVIDAIAIIKELTEENERLKELGTTKEIEKEIVRRETKTCTVRKMQERLERKANYMVCGYYCVSTDDIYQIANELLEDVK